MLRWFARPFSLTALIVLLTLSMACQETTVSGGGAEPGDTYDGPPDRYSELPELDLEPGEAKPGIHLLPGIEVIDLGFGSDSPFVEIDEQSATVTLSGEARDIVEGQEEVWTEDILIGDDFIYSIVGGHEDGDHLIVEVEPFELLRVIHGEWDIGIGDDLSASMLWATIDDNGQVNFQFRPYLEASLGRLKAEAEVAEVEVDGQVSFPVDWQGRFQGKISYLGINRDYECQSYIETQVIHPTPFSSNREPEIREREVQPRRRCIDYLLVMGTVGLNAEAQASIETTGTLTYGMTDQSGSNPDNHVSDNLPLFMQPFRAPLGTTGLALWYTPFVEAGLKAAIEGSLHLGLDAGASVTVPLGFEYDPHGEGFSLLPNDNFPVERGGHLTPWVDDLSIDEATLTLFAKLGMKFALSSVLVTTSNGPRITGPEVGIEYGQELKLTPNFINPETNEPGPCLNTELYLKAYGKGDLRLEAWRWGGFDILDVEQASWRISLAQDASEGTDYCFEQTQTPELAITVTWSDPTAVDLFVETPDEVEIGPDNPQTGAGHYHPAEEGCQESSECMAYVEWINLNDAYQDEPFRIWARNTSGASAVNGEIAVIRDGQPLQTWQVMLPTGAGATSNPILFNYQGR